MIGQRLVDGVLTTALGDRAREFAGEYPPFTGPLGRAGFHPATARG